MLFAASNLMVLKPASSTARRDALPTNVRLLGWVSFWNDIASEMVFPLLPQFLLSTLGGNRALLGLIEGAAESLASLLKLWSGARSDRQGRRKPYIVSGYAIAAICRPVTAVLWAHWQLLAIRLSDRLGKGIRAAPRDALVVDATTPELRGRAFGFQRSMDHLGAAIGPVLATLFLLAFPGQVRWLFALTVFGICGGDPDLAGLQSLCDLGDVLRDGGTGRARVGGQFVHSGKPWIGVRLVQRDGRHCGSSSQSVVWRIV